MPQKSWRSMASTARVPLGTVVVLLLVLLLPAQTADVLAGLVDGGHCGLWPALCFHLALAALAVSAWYWSRAVLAARFPEQVMPNLRDGGDAVALVDAVAWAWLPRILFLAAAASGVVAALRSAAWLQAGLVLVWSGLLLFGLVMRRRAFGARDDLAPQLRVQDGWAFRWEIGMRFGQMLRLAPGGAGLAGLWMGLGIAMLLGSALAAFGFGTEAVRGAVPAWPGLAVLLGTGFPGPGGLFVATAFALPVATALAFVADGLRLPSCWGRLIRRPPVFLPLVLLVAAVPAVVPLHGVRIIPPSRTALGPAVRQPLGELFANWIKACAPGDKDVVRPVIVAVSGEASGGALWAARVLRVVETALPPPEPGTPAIFAVSSVSGGSLGAGAWISTIAGQPDGQRCRTDPTAVPPLGDGVTRADRALSTLGGDVLSPLLTGMLIDDVPRALFGWIPLATGAPPSRGGDRAEALERGLERLWHAGGVRASDDPAQRPMSFDRGFLDLFYGARGEPRTGMPLWLPNATDSVAGRRVVPSAFTSDDPRQWPFRDTGDALALLGADLPIATAIDNSARVAFLLPAGELVPLRRPRDLTDRHYHERPTSVVDGGYFDDTGLVTAVELAEWLRGAEGRQAAGDRPVEPIIIEASADGVRAVGGESVVRCGGLPKDDPSAAGAAGARPSMLTAVIGPAAPGGDHAGLLQRQVRDAWCPRAGHPGQAYFHFYLHAPPEADLPLNWTLSDAAAAWIWRQAMRSCDNAQELLRLRTALAGQNPSAAPQASCIATPGS